MAVSKEWQMVRSWLRKTYNKEVYQYFKDLPSDIDPDNSSSRSTTFAVCLIGARDSQGIAAQKQQNFRRLKEMVGLGGCPPSHDYQRIPGIAFSGIPQVQLWFLEKYSVAKANGRSKHPHEALVSFRINDDWSSDAPAKAMALRIRDRFARPIFKIDSGELKVTYFDKIKGYDFRLLVPTKEEAKQIIEATLDLNGHSPQWKLLKTHSSEDDSFTRETVRIVGETITINSIRPKTNLYFRYAIAKVPPRISEIPLVDTSLRYPMAYQKEPNPFLGRESRVGEIQANKLSIF
jgi:hypothetical protein